jgi:hypothetical protein
VDKKMDETYGAPDGLNLRIREGGENDEELSPVDNRLHEQYTDIGRLHLARNFSQRNSH